MALASTDSLSSFYDPGKAKASAFSAFKHVMDAEWNSSGLTADNAFTTTIVIRTAGILASSRVAAAGEFLGLRRTTGAEWQGKTLREIALALVADFPKKLSIESYPPTAAVAYWLLDGIVNLELELKKVDLENIAKWTRSLLVREVSLISSNHDALMDPIALAMSAALAWRLTGPQRPLHASGIRNDLPTSMEVSHAVSIFLEKQLLSGLWPKYFPLFHFPQSMSGKAGANYCWSFEVLEALLLEIESGFPSCAPSDLDQLFVALERGVTWCEQNRLVYDPDGGTKRTGWNSGGNIYWLQAGIPELWSTAVVHMFAQRAERLLSYLIQREVERKYGAQPFKAKDNRRWNSILDFDLTLVGERAKSSVKKEIETRMVEPILTGQRPLGKSALLFGPPGTSKTSLVKAVAQRVGWSYIELSPNNFLRDGLPNIYSSSGEIFDDLSDLKNVVILFDEMDALARTREDDGGIHPLDVTQQFLTTSMLPNLAHLHDQTGILFFMATNFQSRFDAAIKRPGRFDLLLLVGPPSWSRKVDGIANFWRTGDENDLRELQQLLRKWVPKRTTAAKRLDHFTFGEMSSFFESLLNDAREQENLLAALKKVGKKRFYAKVERWHRDYIALRTRAATRSATADSELSRYRADSKVSRRQ